MKLDHVALWTHRLEAMKDFFVEFFGGRAGQRFDLPEAEFSSYFLSFDDETRLELMQMPTVPPSLDDVEAQFTGYIHIAFAVDTPALLEDLVAAIASRGHRVLEPVHSTADGYIEATVLDPDGNRVEITVLPDSPNLGGPPQVHNP